MKDKISGKINRSPCMLYSVLFFCILAIISLPFVLRGSGLVWEIDGFDIYFPVFVYAGEYIRGMFTGNFPLFDFRLGLGDDVLSVLTAPGFGDIFQIISAFAPVKYAEGAYTFTILVKFYLCGISFMVYGRKYANDNSLLVAGSLLYTFSIFGLVYSFTFWTILNPILILPVILHGLDSILENRNKISLWFILGLFILALNGFYLLYQVTIITVIYFIIVTITRKKNFFWAGLSVMLQGITGACLGGVILLPSIVGFLGSSRAAGEGLLGGSIGRLIADKDFILTSFCYMFIPSVYQSLVTVPLILAAAAVVILVGKNTAEQSSHKEFAVLWGVCGLLFCLPVFNRIMNGFSYATDRWYYAILLFGIMVTVLVMQNDKLFSRKAMVIFWAIAFLSLIMNLFYSDKGIGDMLRTLFFVAIICLLPFIWNREHNRERWLLLFTVITIMASGLFVYGPKVLGGSGFSASFKPYGAAFNEMQDSISAVNQSGEEFARVDIYDSSLLSSLVMNYYGTTAFLSIQNAYMYEFYQGMFISPGIHANSFKLVGLDSRIELASLLGVSHYTDFTLNENDEPDKVVILNELKLPLAFTYESWISEEDFQHMNPLEKTSSMLQSAVIANEMEIDISKLPKNAAMTNIDEKIDIDLELIDIASLSDGFKADGQSFIRVWLKDFNHYHEMEDKKAELYVNISDFIVDDLYGGWNFDVLVGNKNLLLADRGHVYYTGVDEFWINVTSLREMDNKYYFDICFLDENYYSLSDIQVFYHPLDVEALEARAKNSLSEISIETNKISGKITTEKNELLFLSIPYSKGWTAYINGEKTAIHCANIAFCAILLEPGENRIRLTYRSPGLHIGITLTIISLLITFGWILLDRRCKHGTQRDL